MALVTPRTSPAPSIDSSTAMYESPISGLFSGEALIVGPGYINADGRVYNSNGTAANAAAAVHGWVCQAKVAGEPVTLLRGSFRFGYGSGLTPGQFLYVGTTKGRLDNAPTTGGTAPIAFAVNATDIMTIG